MHPKPKEEPLHRDGESRAAPLLCVSGGGLWRLGVLPAWASVRFREGEEAPLGGPGMPLALASWPESLGHWAAPGASPGRSSGDEEPWARSWEGLNSGRRAAQGRSPAHTQRAPF